MRTIRHRAFETNSSSVHSLTFCTIEEYEKFLKGLLYLDTYDEKMVPPQDVDMSGEFDENIFSIRELNRAELTSSYASVKVDHGIKELSDGTRFAYIKYDKCE